MCVFPIRHILSLFSLPAYSDIAIPREGLKMVFKGVVTLLALASTSEAFNFGGTRTRVSSTIQMRPHYMSIENSSNKNIFSNAAKSLVATALVTSLATSSVSHAADYAPAQAPPTLTPQLVTKKSIKAGTPEKWIYSKFLDEVEKNDVEKVTFAPDGKKAVGVNTDGDRFTVDIPNDPNLLSFLVQHKVEINVAPINANGGTGGDAAAALAIPEGETDKLLQTFVIPASIMSLLYVLPTLNVLFPSKEDLENEKKPPSQPRAGPGARGPGMFGPPGGRGGARCLLHITILFIFLVYSNELTLIHHMRPAFVIEDLGGWMLSPSPNPRQRSIYHL